MKKKELRALHSVITDHEMGVFSNFYFKSISLSVLIAYYKNTYTNKLMTKISVIRMLSGLYHLTQQSRFAKTWINSLSLCRVTEPTEKKFPVERLFIHQRFYSPTFLNDIALLSLASVGQLSSSLSLSLSLFLSFSLSIIFKSGVSLLPTNTDLLLFFP